MKFIKPTEITTAKLISSNAPETDHAAWSGATTYALAARCISTTTHRIYESLQAGNLNHDPTTDTGTWWLDVGPTNRWAMFDQTVGTQTSLATPLTVTVAPGIVNSLALLDLDATSVRVQMLDGATSVFDQTYTLGDGAEIVDWYGYYFDPLEPTTELIVDDLPPYGSGQITLTINAATTAKCGTAVFGSMIDIGGSRYGASVGITDYSRKEVDTFGVSSVLERAYAKRFDVPVLVDNQRLDYVTRQLAAVRATPCVWVANENGNEYSSLVAYGFYKDWSADINYPTHSEMRLTIEGLT